jgi:hypothetical protein
MKWLSGAILCLALASCTLNGPDIIVTDLNPYEVAGGFRLDFTLKNPSPLWATVEDITIRIYDDSGALMPHTRIEPAAFPEALAPDSEEPISYFGGTIPFPASYSLLVRTMFDEVTVSGAFPPSI